MAKAAKARKLPDVADLTKAQAKTEHMRLALELKLVPVLLQAERARQPARVQEAERM